MRVRYKKNGTETNASTFNLSSLDEVLTGDDSPSIHELDVFLEATQSWKDMAEAFEDHDVITDNMDTYFFEPTNDEDRKRGFTL